jgi:hypothetical protein
MKRGQALDLAAGLIVRGATGDMEQLCALLDDAGQLRLAAAIRMKMRGVGDAVSAVPRVEPALWSVGHMKRVW